MKPKLKQDIKDELRKKGLSEEMIVLVLDGNLDEFDVLMKVYNKDANLVGKMISLWRQEIAKKKGKSFDEVKEILNERTLEKILEKVKSGELDKGHVKEVLLNILEGENIDKAVKVEKISDDEIEEEIRKIVKEKPGLRANAYMGLIMGKLKGKVDAKKAMEIVERIVKE